MTDFFETFDPNAVPENERSFDLIPVGPQNLQVIDFAVTPCNGGEMIALTIEIMDGQYINRRLWDNLCVRHENPQTQIIAQQALMALYAAIGVDANHLPHTKEEFKDMVCFKPFKGKIGIQKASQKQIEKGYPDDRNKIRYLPRGDEIGRASCRERVSLEV
jgi:hypothetical protein